MKVKERAGSENLVGGHALTERVDVLGDGCDVVEDDAAADHQLIGAQLERRPSRAVVVGVEKGQQQRHAIELVVGVDDVAGDQLDAEGST